MSMIDKYDFKGSDIKLELEFRFEPYYDDISKVKGEVPYKGANRCTNCGLCVAACPYNAIQLDFPKMSIDKHLCSGCGICTSVCATRALTAAPAEQAEKN